MYESINVFGRSSPFEDWSKLLLMLQRAGDIPADQAFALWTIHFEKVLGKKVDYSQDELKKKFSPVFIMVLRKRLIDGFVAMALTSSIDRLADISLRKPELKQELDALKSLRKTLATARTYYQTGRADDTSDCTWNSALPKWAVPFRKLLRSIYEGRHDKQLLGHLGSPPKGGMAAIKFDLLAAGDTIKDTFATLKEDLGKWTADAEGRTHVSSTMVQDIVADNGSGDPLAGGCGPEHRDSDVSVNMRIVVAGVAREDRCQRVTLLVQHPSDSKEASVAALRGTAAFSKMGGSGGTTGRRVCFFYSVGMSWDARRRPDCENNNNNNKGGRLKTVSRITSLWKEDFTAFMQVASDFVTPESENYIVVFPGGGRRLGGGLASQTGLSTEHAMFEIAQKLANRSMQNALL